MCDPVSLGVASLAIGAVGAYAQYDQQNKAAKYQEEMNAYNQKLAIQNMADNYNALAYNQNQERDAATEQLWRDDLEARRAEARARVAAGESGIAGQTVDSIMREIKANQAMYKSSVDMNLENAYAEADSTRRGIWNTYLSETSNQPAVQKGSALQLGIGLAGAGLGAYSAYETAKYRQEQRLKGN